MKESVTFLHHQETNMDSNLLSSESNASESEPISKRRKLNDSPAVLSETGASTSAGTCISNSSSSASSETEIIDASCSGVVEKQSQLQPSSSQTQTSIESGPQSAHDHVNGHGQTVNTLSSSEYVFSSDDSGTSVLTAASSSNTPKSPSPSASANQSAATTSIAKQETVPVTPVVESTGDVENDTSTSIHKQNVNVNLPIEKMINTPQPPLKSTTMSHLKTKYMSQLEYMNREFKKLERQLLGARTRNGQETAGSRERREKLHSFILHLEDTMKQIELGCTLENEGKSTVGIAFSSMGGTTNTSSVSSSSGTDQIKNENNNNVGHTSMSSENQSLSTVRSQLNEEEEEAKEEFARTSALTKLTKEKEEEENVQRLEEHILGNLLPVKDRLTRQLAAQKGAPRNPAGMPVSRRGLQPSTVDKGKGTFAAAAEKRRLAQMMQQQETQQGQDSLNKQPINPQSAGPIARHAAKTQFGKPLGGGSSLTQKLHGTTLGSHQRTHGDGVGIGGDNSKANIGNVTTENTPNAVRKVIYAGMTPGSRQVKSGVSAATGVHDMKIENPTLKNLTIRNASKETSTVISTAPPPPMPFRKVTKNQQQTLSSNPIKSAVPHPLSNHNQTNSAHSASTKVTESPYSAGSSNRATVISKCTVPPPPPGHEMTVVPKTKKSLKDPMLTEEERQEIKVRRKARKIEKRRAEERQRQLILQQQEQEQILQQKQQQQQQASCGMRRAGKSCNGRSVSSQRKGPRIVEYMCALCNETYKSTCDYNPWWALTSHECVKCGKVQIPRLDISTPENTIEYHPALLAHAANDESAKSANKNVTTPSLANISIKGYMQRQTSLVKGNIYNNSNALGSDDDIETSDSDDSDYDNDDDDDEMTPSAKAEHEDFGKDYSGPKFNSYDASRLLIMIQHASTCPGRHKTQKVRDVCTNIKYLMLHVRDCPGTTSTYDICPYPWCRKTKHLLYHLVSCTEPKKCEICSPVTLTPELQQLCGLNQYRREKQIERNKAASARNIPLHKTSIKAHGTNINATNLNIKKEQETSIPSRREVVVLKQNKDTDNVVSLPIPKRHELVVKQESVNIMQQPLTVEKSLSVPSPIPPAKTVEGTRLIPSSSSRNSSLNHPGTRPVPSPIPAPPLAVAASDVTQANIMSSSALSQQNRSKHPGAPANSQVNMKDTPQTITAVSPAIAAAPANPLLSSSSTNNVSTKSHHSISTCRPVTISVNPNLNQVQSSNASTQHTVSRNVAVTKPTSSISTNLPIIKPVNSSAPTSNIARTDASVSTNIPETKPTNFPVTKPTNTFVAASKPKTNPDNSKLNPPEFNSVDSSNLCNGSNISCDPNNNNNNSCHTFKIEGENGNQAGSQYLSKSENLKDKVTTIGGDNGVHEDIKCDLKESATPETKNKPILMKQESNTQDTCPVEPNKTSIDLMSSQKLPPKSTCVGKIPKTASETMLEVGC